MIIMISCLSESPYVLNFKNLCFFDFRQAVHQQCIPQLHSWDAHGNTLQAVSRADVQLVRTLFDAAQKAHGWHSGNLKQSSLDNLGAYLTYAEIPLWLYDFWDWWIGWFTDIPSTRKDLRKRWDVRLASIAKSLQLLPDFELLGLSTKWNSMCVLPSKGVENFIAALVGVFVIKTQIWSLCFFRCRIRWEFESPVIPLLSKIAPSDVILVRSLPAVSAIRKPGDAAEYVPKQQKKSLKSRWRFV